MVERTLTVKVARIARQTPEILSFELAHPAGHRLPGYQAGAHIDVHMPGGFTRQYSLARDAGAEDGASSYLIGVKREPASRGGSHSMHLRVREGDLLPVSTPRNTFPIREQAKHHILLAGGIGMTPLLAMAQALARAGADFQLYLFVRSEEHLAFADTLRDPRIASRLRVHFDDGDASRKINLRQLLATRRPGTHLYVCGPAGFMQAVRHAAAHWPDDVVHTEYFAAPADAAGSTGKAFVLQLKRRGITVPVAGDQTAVDALHGFGIDVPVSCEQGLCGTCVVDAEGEGAEHRDFCLTRGERAKKVALCCSRAKGDTLAIDL